MMARTAMIEPLLSSFLERPSGYLAGNLAAFHFPEN